MCHYQGLQQLPPSLSGLDQNHLEHGRGCRRGGNTTGRSNLLLASYKPFRGLQLLLLWLIWVTLLCSKPDIPKPGCHHAICFLPSSSGLCWPETLFAEELERAHQLAEFMLPGWLHGPARECSDEETGSITMYYTWREKGRLNSWFWTKAYPKFFFLYSMWTLPLVCLKEKVESGKDVEPWLKHLFFYMKRSLVCM